ncbi:MAG: 2-dehydropantoate 2-reductase N-terminal domain-containing protein, partial [Pseudomonadota bacterium]
MIAVFGAGSIGCFIGGALAAAGEEVTLVGRPRLRDELAAGLSLRPLDRKPVAAKPESFRVATAPEALAGAELVLVCVKSGDTAAAAEAIAAHAPADGLVVSLQNGLANAEALARALGHGRVVPGMVAFNVVREGPGRYAQATEGAVMVGAEAADFARRLDGPLVAAEAREDIDAIQRSKLLMNLNNPLCLLSGLSLRDELRSRSWRRVLAAC